MDGTLPGNLSFELALVLLAAAIAVVPLFRRLGLVAVLAYLATGVLLGPHGVGAVSDPERILGASELGVIMLLFVIGLEVSPARLGLLRRPVFGAGGAQVLDLLIEPELLQKIWILRKLLHPMDEIGAMEFMLDKMKNTKSNDEFFSSMKR